uniref:Colanic acid exporter n=1 Tax=Anisakis simplex TaxID=6269 RepID=A0A0M3JJU9_ANISI
LTVFGGVTFGELTVIAIFIVVHTQSVRWKKSTARIAATLSHKYQVWSRFKDC